MRKIIIFAMFTAFAIGANAQPSFGVKGGLNFATISNYDNISISQTAQDIYNGNGDVSYRTGYNFGALLNYSVADGFVAFQPEVLYSNQGMKNSGTVEGIPGSYSSTMKTDYINVPVMVQVYLLPKVLFIEAGPQVGFLLNAKMNVDASIGGFSFSKETDLKDDINTVDFSLAAGLGVQIPGLPIGVNARYTLGLTTVEKNSNSNDATHNGVFQVGAFIRFGGPK